MKVGGSLLESPRLVPHLERWYQWLVQHRQTAHRPADNPSHPNTPSPQAIHPPQTPPTVGVLVGGGRAADVVRQWDAIHHLPARNSHRLALTAMSQTAQLVAQLTQWPLHRLPSQGLPSQGLASHSADLQPWVIDLAEAAAQDPDLPESWDLTSDSLAIWLASRVGASHLLLLKSVAPLEPTLKIARICQLGWVDASFSRMWTAAPMLSVEIAHFHQWPQITQVSRS
jgi:hypothetical protein